jgi:hypothetical protein
MANCRRNFLQLILMSASSWRRLTGTSYRACVLCICLHSWTGQLACYSDRESALNGCADRVNISNAAILGLQEDLKIETGTKYNTALTIFFVPYIIFEIPSNILLKKLKPHLWCTIFPAYISERKRVNNSLQCHYVCLDSAWSWYARASCRIGED